jgi:hypothetical protein
VNSRCEQQSLGMQALLLLLMRARRCREAS